MKRNFSIIRLLLLIWLVPVCSIYAQDKKFETKEKYLEYMNKRFEIGKEEMFYFPIQNEETAELPFNMLSEILFIKNNKIVSFEALTNKAMCTTDKLLNGVNLENVNAGFAKSAEYPNFVFKNIDTGETIVPEKDEIVAVFPFSYKFKYFKYLRIKDRKQIASKLGIKAYILCLDGYYLKSITDISKEQILFQ